MPEQFSLSGFDEAPKTDRLFSQFSLTRRLRHALQGLHSVCAANMD